MTYCCLNANFLCPPMHTPQHTLYFFKSAKQIVSPQTCCSATLLLLVHLLASPNFFYPCFFYSRFVVWIYLCIFSSCLKLFPTLNLNTLVYLLIFYFRSEDISRLSFLNTRSLREKFRESKSWSIRRKSTKTDCIKVGKAGSPCPGLSEGRTPRQTVSR
jgi:hypothetical protein